ncbi:MAG: hypothetical protein ACXABY_04405 [Candidatus Thorarchaeota archaeon]|jgi:hypothetical protein
MTRLGDVFGKGNNLPGYHLTYPRVVGSSGQIPPKALYGLYVMQLYSRDRQYEDNTGEPLYPRYPTWEEFQGFLRVRRSPYYKNNEFVGTDGVKFPPMDRRALTDLAICLTLNPGIERLAIKLERRYRQRKNACRNCGPKRNKKEAV